MIDSHRVIAIIPARGGSKSVPKKNIRPLLGKPLIAWTLELAGRIEMVDRVIVSTDCAVIARTAREYGAEVYERSAELSTDTALVIDTIQDLSRRLDGEGESALYALLLEPTAPLRQERDVMLCVQRLHHQGLDSVATFKAAELNPHRAWCIEGEVPRVFIDGSVPWLPRQQLPSAYQLSGEVYAFRRDRLSLSTGGMLFGRMGAVIVDGAHSLDIDDERDFCMAEFMARERQHEQVTA
ncbi:cytidylyltransferase domain-containing protein [Halomonas kalidii]|uniref:Acylneuraminate cytidylyltransferase family protein n=1 Tax=Halomonas kalidii TaxID=3043293 RepID=A0ABT6VJL2_9GAMM|nr:acylneuraminate cytidylyltransferase family protein [Halomonas kalidii]MDI5934154.1 acylneuraminate cytidylyltransferase family protein [Halomonas kalidii]